MLTYHVEVQCCKLLHEFVRLWHDGVSEYLVVACAVSHVGLHYLRRIFILPTVFKIFHLHQIIAQVFAILLVLEFLERYTPAISIHNKNKPFIKISNFF